MSKVESIILSKIEENKDKECGEFIEHFRLALVNQVGLVKANKIIENVSDIIIDKYSEIEEEKTRRRKDRRARDKTMRRVELYAKWAKEDREKGIV